MKKFEFSGLARATRQRHFKTSSTGVENEMVLSMHGVFNSPRSIYQYSIMASRLSGQTCKFFKFLLSLNSQKRLGYKENNTKYGSLS